MTKRDIALLLAKRHEICPLVAMPVGGGVYTIGYRTKIYSNGNPVQEGDTISLEQAESELAHYIDTQIIPSVDLLQISNDKIFSSVCSLMYDIGVADTLADTELVIMAKQSKVGTMRFNGVSWGASGLCKAFLRHVYLAGVRDVNMVNKRVDEARYFIEDLMIPS
jgi:GH24 family phage-related lysozyme (muramidase)